MQIHFRREIHSNRRWFPIFRFYLAASSRLRSIISCSRRICTARLSLEGKKRNLKVSTYGNWTDSKKLKIIGMFVIKTLFSISVMEPEPEPDRRNHNFLLSGTGTGMQYGSESGFGTRFESGFNIKFNFKKSKLKGQLSGKLAASDIKKARFCAIFLFLENCATFYLDPEPVTGSVPGTRSGTGTKTFPKSEPEPEPHHAIAVPQHWFLYTCADSLRICGLAYSSVVHFKYFYYLLLWYHNQLWKPLQNLC